MDLHTFLITIIAVMAFLTGLGFIFNLLLRSVKDNQSKLGTEIKELKQDIKKETKEVKKDIISLYHSLQGRNVIQYKNNENN